MYEDNRQKRNISLSLSLLFLFYMKSFFEASPEEIMSKTSDFLWSSENQSPLQIISMKAW
jgi:hypothetical protein